MPTYFGYTAGSSSATQDAAQWVRNKAYITGFSCPDVGYQVVKELSLDVAWLSGTSHIRLAVYSAEHILVCQGVAEVTVVAGRSWQGHLTQADITPNPAVLTGGKQYDLAVAFDSVVSNAVTVYYGAGSSGDYVYGATDYTGGFPASLADGSDIASRFNIRCGVDPAGQLPGGGPVDDRFRFRPSSIICYTSTRLQRRNDYWPPDAGILNPGLDAQDDSDSRMIN